MYMQQRDDPIVIRVESRSYMEEAVRPLSWIQNSLFYASKNVARGSSPISSLTVLAWAHVPMFILHLSICVGAEVMLWQTAGKRVAQFLSMINNEVLPHERDRSVVLTVFQFATCPWFRLKSLPFVNQEGGGRCSRISSLLGSLSFLKELTVRKIKNLKVKTAKTICVKCYHMERLVVSCIIINLIKIYRLID